MQVSQKLVNVEVLIRNLVLKIFSKRIRKTPCLLEIPVMIRILQQKIISTQCLRLLRLLRPQKNKLSQHSGGLRKESAHKTQVRSNRRTGQGQGKLVESLSFIIGLFFCETVGRQNARRLLAAKASLDLLARVEFAL